MRLLSRLVSLGRGLTARARMEAELDEELRSSLDELEARGRAAGLSPEEARAAALRLMGNLQGVRMAVRESWLVSGWEAVLQDVRQAARGLRSTRGASTLAVLTFALGIGSTAAILAVVKATLLSPPPYRDPGRLYLVWADLTAAGHPRAPLSGPELNDLRTRSSAFEGFAGLWANSITLTRHGEPEFVRIGLVTANFFSLVGAEPAAGRLLQQEDEVQGAPGSILLSFALWQRRFGGDPGIVGRAITVNDHPTIVVGVLSRRFRLRLPPDSGIPDAIEAFQLFGPGIAEGPRGQRYLRVFGRARPGVDLPAAREDVSRIAAQLSREHPSPRGTAFTTVALTADTTRTVRGPLAAVAASVVLLLLIAAVNVLGVLIARAATRRREMAVRVALGAGLGRILRLSLAEGLILAALGLAVGMVVGRIELEALRALQPEALRRLGEVSLDARVLAATGGLALLWGALFAWAPLREYARSDVSAVLAATRGEVARLRPRARSALVVAQVALTLVLLVAAMLLARSFSRIQAIDPGFHAAGVLTFRVPSATARYPTPEARRTLALSITEALAALPSATGVGAASHLPYDVIPNWGGPYSATEATDEAMPNADYRSVDPGFFAAAGVEVLAGRVFTDQDHERSEPVAIVDERLARRVWPDASPLGRRLRVDPWSTGTPDTWVTVVGVVRHVRHRSLVEVLNEQVYFPLSQAFRNPVAYLLRTPGPPAELAPAVRAAIRQIDPDLPIYEVQPLAAYLERARSVQRFTMVLVGVFAGTALVLAASGVYGVIAYLVVARRREFGVRLALGATPSQVGALVLREGARLLSAGAVLGLAGAAALAPLLRGLLYGVGSADAVAYLVAVPLLALAALLACLVPVRRATAADVLDVLRAE